MLLLLLLLFPAAVVPADAPIEAPAEPPIASPPPGAVVLVAFPTPRLVGFCLLLTFLPCPCACACACASAPPPLPSPPTASPAVGAAVFVPALDSDFKVTRGGGAVVTAAAVRYARGTTSINRKSKQDEFRNVAWGSEAL